jgi:hypothetical protein
MAAVLLHSLPAISPRITKLRAWQFPRSAPLMFGQGSPQFGPRRSLRQLAAALIATALCLSASLAAAADVDIRLRIAWGGGESKSWQGTIQLTQGTLSEVAPLGLEADDPGSMQLTADGGIRIFPRSLRSYDGCDLRVQAPAEASLLVSIAPQGAASVAPLEIPLATALRSVAQFSLDENQNRLLVQRSPGDSLRVEFARDHLVFAPGETLELDVTANPADVSPATSYLLAASLLVGRSDQQLWNEDAELKTGGNDQPATPVKVEVPLPAEEGVYDVRLALYPKRLTSTLVRGKPIFSRKVQVVVVAPVATINREPAVWQSVLEIDPANPKWWERMARLPSSLRLPTLPAQPVGSGPPVTRNHLQRTWVELPPGAWRAFPLAVSAPGQPHVLEIEYPSDLAQTLGISIVEPNAAGQVGPIGLDSGIDVPEPGPDHQPAISKHRVTFWPKTRAPLVLMVNRRDNQPAVFGRFNLLAGPMELPPLALPAAKTAGRTLAAYYDKPLLAENFSATEVVDPVTGRCLDDWQTFLDAGRRMVQYLQHTGQNAAIITVACDGGAIYPSQLFEPTPRFDNGLFFESGQDPRRKDVLELLFRLCDRAGIQLIPAVQFAAPLPRLESQRLAEGEEKLGLEPVGADGRTWLDRSGARRGMGVYYNALDPRVQAEMTAVVAELAERYGRHPSFAGVSVQLGAESYAVLPDEAASYDTATLNAFVQAASIDATEEVAALHANPAEYLHGPGEEAWLNWRTARMTALYRQMLEAVTRERTSARLFLATGDLLGGKAAQAALRPTLPERGDPAMVWRLMGLDFQQLTAAGIVTPRPQRVLPEPLALREFHDHWSRSDALSAIFHQGGRAAALHYLEPAPLRLPDFDAVSPFGPQRTSTWLVAQIASAGPAARERMVRSLASSDAPLIIDGGWLLPLGQEQELAPLVKTFRRLPADAFTAVKAADAESTPEVIVRKLQRGGKTVFYAVNTAPWPTQLSIDLASLEPLRVTPYADERPGELQLRGDHSTWTVQMQPFDLIGGEIASERVTFIGYRVTAPNDAAAHIREQIRSVRLQTNSLRSPVPSDILVNASFEADAAAGPIPGWLHAKGPGMEVAARPGAGYRSNGALRVASRPIGNGAAPVVWVRSDPLPVPTTGRLSLYAWVRVPDSSRQPVLRLAIEGKVDGRVKYWKANIGASEDGQPVRPLTTEWAAFRFPVVDLPQSGLTDLRVGFDLMGEGEVWIDEVQVFDLWFEEKERDELLKSIATADLQASTGNLADSQEFLSSYWPSFLRRHVPLPESRSATAGGIRANAAPAAPAPAKPPAPSMTERLKTWLPKSWR